VQELDLTLILKKRYKQCARDRGKERTARNGSKLTRAAFPHAALNMGFDIMPGARYSGFTLWFFAHRRKAKMGIR
jgi:hypothetical protein